MKSFSTVFFVVGFSSLAAGAPQFAAGPLLAAGPAPLLGPAPLRPLPHPVVPVAPVYRPAPVPVVAPVAPAYGPGPVYAEGPAVYDFSYGVNDPLTGQNFGHSENRDGYITQGTYYVNLPDGRLQTVNYHADDVSGYVADVKYSGEPLVPAYAPAPIPVGPAYAPAIAAPIRPVLPVAAPVRPFLPAPLPARPLLPAPVQAFRPLGVAPGPVIRPLGAGPLFHGPIVAREAAPFEETPAEASQVAGTSEEHESP